MECPLPSFDDGPKVGMFLEIWGYFEFNSLQNRKFLLVVVLFTDAQIYSRIFIGITQMHCLLVGVYLLSSNMRMHIHMGFFCHVCRVLDLLTDDFIIIILCQRICF